MPLKVADEKIWILPSSERLEDYVIVYCERLKDVGVLSKIFQFLRIRGGQIVNNEQIRKLKEYDPQLLL